jgi:hypothetical protein
VKSWPPDFSARLVAIASGQVGTHEVGGNNNGQQIRAYQSATWLHPASWSWCAAFVCWCFKAVSIQYPVGSLELPTTPRAAEFLTWGGENAVCHPHPKSVAVGNVVVYHFPTGYHCGIVSKILHDGYFMAVEGNTGSDDRDGDGVYFKTRHVSQVVGSVSLL